MATTTTKSETLPIRSETDIVQVRQVVRTWCAGLGFSLVEQTKMVTAASELARNTYGHGGGGDVRLESLADGSRKGLRLTFQDRGRGIPDITLAMRDGYTTGGGLGMGLPGAKRLVTEFDIASKVGEGTRVTIARWK
jgi:serine/threonine-protein kinase RsbT